MTGAVHANFSREGTMISAMNVPFAVLMILVLALPLRAAEPSVSVSAQGHASAVPDMVEFDVRLQDTAPSAARALALTAEKYSRVRAALRGSGVSDDDAVSRSFSVREKREWDNERKIRVFKGYTATHDLKVTVRRKDRAGAVIDAVAGAGADGISGIRFTSSRYDELQSEALADAVAAARSDAEVMARAAGVSLGRLIGMQTAAPRSYPVRDQVSFAVEKLAAPAPVTEIQPGELDVTVQVYCSWELSGGR
ncbi:SIMPL domain-containing protein [Prosthecochloris sp. N3]|uniref:SIMPL domain-containing protein n=2 Tax=Prosthecochloris ethylica TaxID=2743976 RepID=A0ABR9XNL1_9CHLB|nr:SIMPL domain-containing protein [Prosthecochloris ethylica]MBF0585719.1 SIMPL domain-containing protein [Prosthecochloris ethylica]MBF0635629.1 SIMPL domain-containing protein [Prosthecochloris ethylica]